MSIKQIKTLLAKADALGVKADQLELDAEDARWEAAHQIAAELDKGTTQRALAKEIGRSESFVRRYARMSRDYGERAVRGTHRWGELYALVKASPGDRESLIEEAQATGRSIRTMQNQREADRGYERRHRQDSPAFVQSREPTEREQESREHLDALAVGRLLSNVEVTLNEIIAYLKRSPAGDWASWAEAPYDRCRVRMDWIGTLLRSGSIDSELDVLLGRES